MIRIERPRRSVAHRASLAVLAVAITCTALGIGPVAASAVESDIPGEPLPGSVAAGRLGGTIYDVVYRLMAPPAHVIVASLTGTAGTDFDMYLFDQTATTVVSTAGLLIKSNGPTSTESISWPSRFGGTYYVDLNGATDVEGDYLLTVQVVPDPTPPEVTIDLAAGKTVTNQYTVPVRAVANDDLSGVVSMAFSEDGVTFGSWLPVAENTTWTFPVGDGPRRLWAKVINGVGLESLIATDAITIDTVPPQVVTLDPLPGTRVVGLRPTLTVTFDEAISAASWTDLGLVVQLASGGLIVGSYAYDEAKRQGSFTPSAPLQPGALYLVTIGDVSDLAGNRVPSPGSWTITPLAPTALQVDGRPTASTRGTPRTIDVSLSGAPFPASIDVEVAAGGDGFAYLTTISTDDGQNSLVVSPRSNTSYRFRYSGTPSVAAAEATVRLLVRRSIVLIGRSSSSVSRATVGRSVALTAAASPAASGLSVSFRSYRFDVGRRSWIYAGSFGRKTDAQGRAALTWLPKTAGLVYWRAVVASTVDYANNTSPVYRWSVSP
jgi:hypothetical protein